MDIAPFQGETRSRFCETPYTHDLGRLHPINELEQVGVADRKESISFVSREMVRCTVFAAFFQKY